MLERSSLLSLSSSMRTWDQGTTTGGHKLMGGRRGTRGRRLAGTATYGATHWAQAAGLQGGANDNWSILSHLSFVIAGPGVADGQNPHP